jgi:5,10-methenyltetrahydromethanopterin hydrogenase
MSTETISASNNPALANKLVSEALSETEVAGPAPKAEIPLPPETQVELPGGLLDPFDGLVNTAEIRELTGADEEVIARIGDPGKSLLSILERATVKIGDKSADKETLDALLAGDREALLLAIRIATFGPSVKLGPVCPSCGEDQEFEIDLHKDVKVKSLKEGDRTFTLDCKVGKVVVSLPTGGAQKALVNATNKNAAELDTILLKSCVESINGTPVLNIQQIKDLSLKDRRDLIKAITDRNPGPQLSEIKKTCKACDSEVSLPLTLADLFRE